MTPQQFIGDIRQLIAEDQLPNALQQMQRLLEKSPLLDDVIHQSGRLAAIRKQISLGTVSVADADLTRNQIRSGLLDLLRLVEDQQGEKPAIREEIGKYTADVTIIQNADKIYNIDKIDNANFS